MSYLGDLLEAHVVIRGQLHLCRVPNYPHSSDERGWITHRVVARVGMKEVGHITVSHIPRAVYEEQLADPSSEVARKSSDRRRKFQTFNVDSVHVAYVHVDPNHWRQGIARSLYLEAARWMGESGFLLSASDQQKPEVKTLWRSFFDDPELPTSVTADGRLALNFVGA